MTIPKNKEGKYNLTVDLGRVEMDTIPAALCKHWDSEGMNIDCEGKQLSEPTIGYCPAVEHCTRPDDGLQCLKYLGKTAPPDPDPTSPSHPSHPSDPS